MQCASWLALDNKPDLSHRILMWLCSRLQFLSAVMSEWKLFYFALALQGFGFWSFFGWAAPLANHSQPRPVGKDVS